MKVWWMRAWSNYPPVLRICLIFFPAFFKERKLLLLITEHSSAVKGSQDYLPCALVHFSKESRLDQRIITTIHYCGREFSPCRKDSTIKGSSTR